MDKQKVFDALFALLIFIVLLVFAYTVGNIYANIGLTVLAFGYGVKSVNDLKR